MVDTLKSRASHKLVIDKAEDKDNKKCYGSMKRDVLALVWANPRHPITGCRGEAWWKGQVDTRLNRSQQEVFPINKTNHILSSSRKRVSSRSNYNPPLHTWKTVSHSGCSHSQVKRDMQTQQRDTKMVQKIDDITCKKLFYLMNGRQWSHKIWLGRFNLDTRKNFLRRVTVEEVPRDAAKSPSMGIFTTCLDKATADSRCWQ